jgi:hypothetical protein
MACQADPFRFGLFDGGTDVSHITGTVRPAFEAVKSRDERSRREIFLSFCGATIPGKHPG